MKKYHYYQNIILSHYKKRLQRSHIYYGDGRDLPNIKKTEEEKEEASMQCNLLHRS